MSVMMLLKLMCSETDLLCRGAISLRLRAQLTPPLFSRTHLPCHCLSACLALPTPSLLLLARVDRKKWLWRRERAPRHSQALPPSDSALSSRRKKGNDCEHLWLATSFWLSLYSVHDEQIVRHYISFFPLLMCCLMSDLLIASDCISQISKELLNRCSSLATKATATGLAHCLRDQGSARAAEWVTPV